MAEVLSPVNDTTQGSLKLDGVWLTTSDDGLHKKAIAGTAAAISGVASGQAATQQVGTTTDDAVFTPGTDVTVVLAGFADETSPDSVSEGDSGALRMTLARNLHIVSVADAAAVTSVASQDTNINLLAANANRIGAICHNTDTGPLYLKFGSTATTSSFTVKIPADGYYEFPNPVYRGAVDGIWTTSGAGAAILTELT